MKVAVSIFMQNTNNKWTDYEVYQNDLKLADLAEPLGFDSIWSVEHHFTPYTMVPDVLQFLTYMAGRTSKVELGSMVVVLPWHDPVRVAEQIAMLDNLSKGRIVIGFGRGAATVEYNGFRVAMEESRERFMVWTAQLKGYLTKTWCRNLLHAYSGVGIEFHLQGTNDHPLHPTRADGENGRQ
jgi:alkanesulfonate monooxygenase SsuD/methylene tetrahydromethanopterin reductase-like flavin-dependent oxidoreductase (luciferase family)